MTMRRSEGLVDLLWSNAPTPQVGRRQALVARANVNANCGDRKGKKEVSGRLEAQIRRPGAAAAPNTVATKDQIRRPGAAAAPDTVATKGRRREFLLEQRLPVKVRGRQFFFFSFVVVVEDFMKLFLCRSRAAAADDIVRGRPGTKDDGRPGAGAESYDQGAKLPAGTALWPAAAAAAAASRCGPGDASSSLPQETLRLRFAGGPS
jgi:hypothetical protein